MVKFLPLALVGVALCSDARAGVETEVRNAKCSLLLMDAELRRQNMLRADIATFLDGFEYGITVAGNVLGEETAMRDFLSRLQLYRDVCEADPDLTVRAAFGRVFDRVREEAD